MRRAWLSPPIRDGTPPGPEGYHLSQEVRDRVVRFAQQVRHAGILNMAHTHGDPRTHVPNTARS